MFPEPLASIFEQYKQDTAVAASWLVQTAKPCGYAKVLATINADANPAKPKSGRLKGKTRKEATGAATDGRAAKPTGASRKSEHVLAIQDFVALAEFIAAVQKPQPVRCRTPWPRR